MKIIQEIKLSLIKVDRFKLSPKVFLFARLMEQGVIFPPVRLYRWENGLFKLSDGRHRISAIKLLGKSTIRGRFSVTNKNIHKPADT